MNIMPRREGGDIGLQSPITNQSQHSHRIVTAQSQHSHSTVTAQGESGIASDCNHQSASGKHRHQAEHIHTVRGAVAHSAEKCGRNGRHQAQVKATAVEPAVPKIAKALGGGGGSNNVPAPREGVQVGGHRGGGRELKQSVKQGPALWNLHNHA